VALKQAAADAAATFVPGIVEDLDPAAQVVSIPGSHPRAYDALVLALGAEQIPAIEHALTWDDRADSELLGGLVADIEEGYSRNVAVVIPPGPGGRCAATSSHCSSRATCGGCAPTPARCS